MEIFTSFRDVKFDDEPVVPKWVYPELHKESILEGKILLWRIGYSDETKEIIITHGFIDGKIQINTHKIELNTRSKSYTDQALVEVRSRYTDKINEGYYFGDINERRVNFKPMLAEKYVPGKTRLEFPMFCQAKLDGVRLISRIENGKLTLCSRTGKEISFFSELKNELEGIFKYLEPKTVIDGELYSQSIDFNKISGITRKKLEADSQEKEIKYYIFDIMDPSNSLFSVRYSKIRSAFKSYMKDTTKKDEIYYFDYLRLIGVTRIDKEEDISKNHTKFTSEGFEGIILRKNKEYKNSRTTNLLKYKDFEEEEFEIVGFSEGKGTEKGLIIWDLVTSDGGKFSARPQGSFEERRKLFQDGHSYIGKKLTVKFQERSEDGIPRFPIGKSVRDDI